MAPLPSRASAGLKIIVLDDDPTGSQSVHGCPLLLRWDPTTLKQALLDPSPCCFCSATPVRWSPIRRRSG